MDLSSRTAVCVVMPVVKCLTQGDVMGKGGQKASDMEQLMRISVDVELARPKSFGYPLSTATNESDLL